MLAAAGVSNWSLGPRRRWRGQLERRGTASYTNITDATLCGLFEALQPAPPVVNGAVLYTSAAPVGDGYTMPMALTLALQRRLLPVTAEVVSAHPCLGKLPVAVDMRIGKMPQMASREAAWRWAVDELLPNASTTVVFNIYHYWSGKGALSTQQRQLGDTSLCACWLVELASL